MKKIILAICLCTGLAACGSSDNSGSHTDNNSPAFTDTSSNTTGNVGTPAKQSGDTTLDSAHRAAQNPAAKTKNTNPDTTNAGSH